VNGRRNIPLKKLARLYRPDVEFYSLQKGQPAEAELADLTSDERGGPKPLDHTELLHDFSDTAAFIENLDLIIAVDTPRRTWRPHWASRSGCSIDSTPVGAGDARAHRSAV
jgi:hypothetical protein